MGGGEGLETSDKVWSFGFFFNPSLNFWDFLQTIHCTSIFRQTTDKKDQ